VWKKEHFYIIGGNVNSHHYAKQYNHYGQSLCNMGWRFLKNLEIEIELSYNLAKSLLGIYLKEFQEKIKTLAYPCLLKHNS
jgi:hypothetical protein